MAVVIPDEICTATHLSENELKQEIAVMLFQKNKITIGQASKLAGVGLIEFQHILASRKIPVHYDSNDLKHDYDTLKEMGLL
jgi:predicted HTH domain antitoxin